MKRRLLSLLLVLLMCISLFPLTAMAADYSDTSGHWAEAEIAKWSGAGVLTGSDGNFRPNDSITRAEMATIFDRLMAYRTKAENKFTDLGTSWYADAILRANAAGLMLGSDGLVRPNDKITRQEAAILICRAMGIPEKSGSTSFADDTSIAGWAKGYVNALSSAGLIAGVGDNRFAPTDSINRASVVKMLDNAIKGFYQKSGEYTGDVAGNAVVNSADVTLKNMTITGNLIIAEGVGNGDVKLDNVKVNGKLIARGGGVNSIHIIGNSQVSSIIIQKTDDGGIRVVTESGSVVEAVFIDDGKDDVILTGSFKAVTVAADVPVSAVGATIASVNVTGAGASLTVDSASKVTAVTVAETAAKAEISVKGEVGTLTANAEIKVDNQGTIKKADVKADNVVIDGNKPAEVVVDTSVKEPPKSSDGKPVEGGGTPPSGGGGGYVPPVDPKVANVSSLTDLLAALDNSEKETININADISDIESTIKVERKVTINGNNKTLTFKSLAGEDDGEQNGLLIMTDGVTVKDLKVTMADGANMEGDVPKWDGVYGIQVYNVQGSGVTLNNYTGSGGDAALLVNGSRVTLTGTTTVSDNQFGGIEVSKGTAGGLENSVLTINGDVVNTTEAENLPTVWVDGADGGTVEGSNTLCLNKKTVSSQEHYFLSEVSTVGQLTYKLSQDFMKDIKINGTIGNEDNFNIYTVNRAVTLRSGTVYGSFVVTAEDAKFDGITIYNQGGAGANKNAINFYGDKITVTDCTFEMLNTVNGFGNGMVIYPKTSSSALTISNNTFKGYEEQDGGWSSAGLLIATSFNFKTYGKDGFLGDHVSDKPKNINDLALISGNTFTGCNVDYCRDDWADGTTGKIAVTAISTGSNLRLNYAGDSAKYYITGNVARNSDAEIKAGSELVITDGKTLTIAEDTTLTVNGKLVNNGSLVNNGILSINDTRQLSGDNDYTITKTGTLKVGTAEYISGSGTAIVKIDNPISIIGNVNGGYTVTIPSDTTATVQNRNSTSSDIYHHGTNDVIKVESGGKLVVAKNFGNNGLIDVYGTLEIVSGVSIHATSNPATKTITIHTGATAPNPFAEAKSYTWNGTEWK